MVYTFSVVRQLSRRSIVSFPSVLFGFSFLLIYLFLLCRFSFPIAAICRCFFCYLAILSMLSIYAFVVVCLFFRCYSILLICFSFRSDKAKHYYICACVCARPRILGRAHIYNNERCRLLLTKVWTLVKITTFLKLFPRNIWWNGK